MWAIVAGTGFDQLCTQNVLEELSCETPFGDCASGLKRIKILDQEILFLPRHSKKQNLLAHEINYRANIFALKRFGATKILALSSVLSIAEAYKPGDVIVPNQYQNLTKREREHTFCGDGVLGHVSLLRPTTTELLSRTQEIVPQIDFNIHLNACYGCIDGPQSPTLAELKFFRKMGIDIVGTTQYPEYALAREAGMGYLPCCFVADHQAQEKVNAAISPAHLKACRAENSNKASQLLTLVVNTMRDILPNGCPNKGLQQALLTAWEDIPAEKKSWLGLLLNR